MVWACAGIICFVPLACIASSAVWNGTWKLNQPKSIIPGPSFSITILSTGEYHLENGTYSYSFRCDGKEYPTTADRTVSCTQTSTSMDRTGNDDRKKVGTEHWELSADGKTLTITTKSASTKTDGSVKPIEKVYSHTSGSSGFAGGWEYTKRLESRPQLVLMLNERSLHIAFSNGEYIDPPLDGTDAPFHGPGVPQGLTLSIKPNGPLEFLTVMKFGGHITSQGSLRLSADGGTLVEEYWPPSRPDQKATLDYEKQ